MDIVGWHQAALLLGLVKIAYGVGTNRLAWVAAGLLMQLAGTFL